MPRTNDWSFSDTFDDAAKREGWAIFDTGNTLEICKIDDVEEVAEEIGAPVPELRDDIEAVSLVITKALAGSKLHAFALYIDGRTSGYDRTIIPDEFRDYIKKA